MLQVWKQEKQIIDCYSQSIAHACLGAVEMYETHECTLDLLQGLLACANLFKTMQLALNNIDGGAKNAQQKYSKENT